MRCDLLRRFLARRTARRFDALVEGTRARLLSAAWRVLGDLHDAEDTVQEVYVKVLKEERDPRSVCSGLGWLVRTTVLRARTKLRGESRRRMREERAVGARAPAGAALADEASANAEVRHAVTGLPDELRATVELRYFGGLSTRDIADALDVSSRAVDKRLKRAREDLAPRLTPVALGMFQSALHQSLTAPPAVVAAAGGIEGAAIRTAAGVTLPAFAGGTLAAVGGGLLLLVGLVVGGVVLFQSGRDAKPGPDAASSDAAAAVRVAGAPRPARLAGTAAPARTPAAGEAPGEEAPSGATASRSLTLRVIGPDGALVRRGRMKFSPATEEDEREFGRVVRANPELRIWKWLRGWFPLAQFNPLELSGIPSVFLDRPIVLGVDVPGCYGPPEITIPSDSDTVREIRLSPSFAREIEVRDAVTGLPLEGVGLETRRWGPGEVEIAPHGRRGEGPVRAKTDVAGTAALNDLAPEWAWVAAARAGYHPAHVRLGRGDARLKVELVPLGRPAVLEVRAYREPGVPWPGATIVLEHQPVCERVTGDDGRARFEDLAPGEARVRFSNKSARRLADWTEHQYVSVVLGGPDVPTDVPVELRAGETTRMQLGLLVRGSGVVGVRVESSTGEPVAGAQVSLYGPVRRLGRTDVAGRVAFEGLPPGRYGACSWRIEEAPPDVPTTTQQTCEDLMVRDGTTRHATLVFGDRTLRVRLDTPLDDGPESPVWVVLRRPDGIWQGWTDVKVESFVFRHVAPGAWDVVAGAVGLVEVRRTVSVSADADPDPLNLKLVRGGRVTFRFAHAEDPRRLLALRARVVAADGETHPLTLDPGGGLVWTSSPLRPGSWTLVVERPGEARLERRVEVANGAVLRLEL